MQKEAFRRRVATAFVAVSLVAVATIHHPSFHLESHIVHAQVEEITPDQSGDIFVAPKPQDLPNNPILSRVATALGVLPTPSQPKNIAAPKRPISKIKTSLEIAWLARGIPGRPSTLQTNHFSTPQQRYRVVDNVLLPEWMFESSQSPGYGTEPLPFGSSVPGASRTLQPSYWEGPRIETVHHHGVLMQAMPEYPYMNFVEPYSHSALRAGGLSKPRSQTMQQREWRPPVRPTIQTGGVLMEDITRGSVENRPATTPPPIQSPFTPSTTEPFPFSLPPGGELLPGVVYTSRQ